MILHVVLVGVLSVGSVAFAGGQGPQGAAANTAPAVQVPETPAGTALGEFVSSFNEGGDKRKAWLETRTTLEPEQVSNILQQDAAILAKHGPATVVKIPQSSASSIQAVIRHATSGAHGHLTIEVEAASPYKVTNVQIRPATPEEIK